MQDSGIGAILEGVRDAVVVAGASTGRIVYWNPAASEVFGYASAEALGHNIEQLLPGLLQARQRAETSSYSETGHGRYIGSGRVLDLPAVLKGGEEIGVEVTLSPIELAHHAGDREQFVLAIVRNVSERRRAEEEVRQPNQELEEQSTERTAQLGSAGTRLRDSEERYRLLVESLSDYAIFIVEANGRIANWNVGAEHIFGYREEEIVGEAYSVIFTPEDARRGVPEWQFRTAIAEGRAEDERWHVRKDGSRFWASGIVAPIWDETGSLRGFTKVARDLTERRRAEEMLRNSEASLAEAQRIAHLGSWDTGPLEDGVPWIKQQIRCSDEMYRILGYAPQDTPLTFETIVESTHPQDRERVLRAVYSSMVKGETFLDIEHRILRPNGEVRSVQARMETVFDEGGEPVRKFGTILDITERKQAEDASRESRTQVHSIIDGVAAAIFLKDSQGRYVIVNSTCVEIVGKPAEEILGKKDADLYSPEVADSLVEVDRRVMDTGETITLEESLPVAGSMRTYRSTKSPYYDHRGNVAGVIGVSTDITEHKKAEERLREAERRYRTLIERIPAITYIQEPSEPSRTIYISPQYEAVLGYSSQESLSDPEHWVRIMHPADRERVLAEDRRTNETGEPFSMEYRQFAKDGRVVWIRDEATLVPDEEGNPSYWLGVQTDITEHKLAEERLQEAEALYRSLVEEVPGAIYIQEIEHEGAISYISPQIEDMMGYSPQEYIDDPDLWVRATHPEDRERVLAEDRRTDETGEPFRIECRKITRDGRVIWVRDEAVLVKTPEGTPLYWQGICVDITERKRAEEELKRSEERYRRLVENSPDTIAVLGEEKILFVNAAGAMHAGAESPKDLIGKPYLDFVHPDFRETVKSRVSRAQREGVTAEPLEEKLLRLDGSAVDVEATVIPITEGDRVAALSVIRDITERKRAQKEIETRTHQQAVVAEFGNQALAEMDLQTLMDRAVSLVAQTLDVEYCKILELLSEGDELLLRAGIGWEEGLVGRATEETGPDSQAGFTLLSEVPVVVEDLREEVRFRASTLLHDHGAVSGMSVIISDRGQPFGILGAYTKSRRTFTGNDINFLRAIANVLAAAIERVQVEEVLREIRETERNRLARDLHDEALQDLTRALIETQLLQTTSEDPGLNHRLERVVEALKQAGHGMHAAIYDLRLEGAGREQTLVEMLESLVDLTREGSPDCEIELFVEDGFSSTFLGKRQVEVFRILREALTNALRHSRPSRIRITLGTSGGRLRAEVEDDGLGFDPTQPPSGMGLKGMRERAHALRGDLKIGSKPGEGTKVRFELAHHRNQGESEEARILFVDDHASIRQAMASVFEREPGFMVVGQAGSLSEARQMLETSEPVDVAVIDLRLPDGYGGELIKDLRAHNPRAQALVLSAILDRTELAQAVESGAAGVLHKSAGLNEVLEAVERLRAGETLLPLEEVVELLRFAGSQREEEYEARQAIARLTSREKELLQALAEGLDSKEIAERLHISVKTEANHLTSILNKLGVHSRLQALVFAVRHGVVEIH